MMKKRMGFICAAVASLVTASIATADVNVWFELNETGSTEGVELVSQGEGQTLQITKPATGTFDVALIVKSNATGVGFNGGVIDLSTDSADVSPVQGSFSSNASLQLANAGTGYNDGPGTLITNFGASGFFPLPDGVNELFRITVTVSKDGPGVHNLFVFGGSVNGFGDSNDGNILFGPNSPGIPGGIANATLPAGDPNLAVVTITNIPEPGTLALLAIGGIALALRRRR